MSLRLRTATIEKCEIHDNNMPLARGMLSAIIEKPSFNRPDTHMTIEISREARKEAIASIERYFQENMEERIGNVAAGALLGFFLEELGPIVYNKAVAEVQERLQARIAEIDIEIHEDEFQYWRKFDRQRKN